MKLDLTQVRHVAKLARLALTPAEELKAVEQLSAVLDAVDALAQVNTEGVAPTVFTAASGPTDRSDVVAEELPLENVFANAPQRLDSFFALPKVLG